MSAEVPGQSVPPTVTSLPDAAVTVVSRRPAAPALRGLTAARSDARLLALGAASVLVAIPYLLSLASPLRLQPDSVTYLSLAAGLPSPAHHQGYPPGYPAMLNALEHLGLGTPWGFVGANLILLAAGLAAAYVLCRRELGLSPMLAAVVCLGTLLSRTVSLFSTSPLSELPYFGVALLCVLVLSIAERRSGRERLAWLGAALVLAAAAVSIRILGLALVAPLLFVAVGGDRLGRVARAIRRGRPAALAWCAVALVVIVVVGVVAVQLTPYWHHIASVWRSTGIVDSLHRLVLEMRTKVVSLAELSSQTTCCTRVPLSVRPAYIGLGLVVAGLIVYGWLGRRRFGVVEAFIVGTAAVILVYAGGVARFWIAVIPFLLAYAGLGGLRLARFRPLRYALVLFAAAFVLAGGVWLADSVLISTAGRQFPSRWARQVSPQLVSSYSVAWGQAHLWDLARAEPSAVTLLHRYEPLARVWEW